MVLLYYYFYFIGTSAEDEDGESDNGEIIRKRQLVRSKKFKNSRKKYDVGYSLTSFWRGRILIPRPGDNHNNYFQRIS
jgi:hypothetical protein